MSNIGISNSFINQAHHLNYTKISKDFTILPNSSKYLEIGIDLISQNEKALIEKFTCFRCENFAVNPTICKSCNIYYCFKCVNELITVEEGLSQHKCPKCCSQWNLKVQGLETKDLKDISSIKIKCLSKNSECENPISYNDYLIHLQNCKFWQGIAKCNKCSQIYNMKHIPGHIKLCNGKIVKCRFCFAKFMCDKKKELIEHQKNCIQKIYKKKHDDKNKNKILDSSNASISGNKTDPYFNNYNNHLNNSFQNKLKQMTPRNLNTNYSDNMMNNVENKNSQINNNTIIHQPDSYNSYSNSENSKNNKNNIPHNNYIAFSKTYSKPNSDKLSNEGLNNIKSNEISSPNPPLIVDKTNKDMESTYVINTKNSKKVQQNKNSDATPEIEIPILSYSENKNTMNCNNEGVKDSFCRINDNENIAHQNNPFDIINNSGSKRNNLKEKVNKGEKNGKFFLNDIEDNNDEIPLLKKKREATFESYNIEANSKNSQNNNPNNRKINQKSKGNTRDEKTRLNISPDLNKVGCLNIITNNKEDIIISKSNKNSSIGNINSNSILVNNKEIDKELELEEGEIVSEFSNIGSKTDFFHSQKVEQQNSKNPTFSYGDVNNKYNLNSSKSPYFGLFQEYLEKNAINISNTNPQLTSDLQNKFYKYISNLLSCGYNYTGIANLLKNNSSNFMSGCNGQNFIPPEFSGFNAKTGLNNNFIQPMFPMQKQMSNLQCDDFNHDTINSQVYQMYISQKNFPDGQYFFTPDFQRINYFNESDPQTNADFNGSVHRQSHLFVNNFQANEHIRPILNNHSNNNYLSISRDRDIICNNYNFNYSKNCMDNNAPNINISSKRLALKNNIKAVNNFSLIFHEENAKNLSILKNEIFDNSESFITSKINNNKNYNDYQDNLYNNCSGMFNNNPDFDPCASNRYKYDTNETNLCFLCNEIGHISSTCPHIVCYICNKTGHISNRCPQIICFICNEIGHVSYRCPQSHCYRCNQKGHYANKCPSNKKEKVED